MHFAIRYYVCERTHVHKMITVTSEVCGRQHNTAEIAFINRVHAPSICG